ncbi:MAG: hypothetical protein RJA36_2921 [Pseudomonadota bacterium]|jgi:hypothetical protein
MPYADSAFARAARRARRLAVALACAMLALPPAPAAELRPYSLPSQQQQMVRPVEPPVQTQIPAQTQAPVQAGLAPSPEYYQDYASWARKLKPRQRAELARGFERDARRAAAAGRSDEALHYRRLVGILRASR